MRSFKNIPIITVTALIVMVVVQCAWIWRFYSNSVEDFRGKVESTAFKTIYKTFRMNSIPGISSAEVINIDIDDFNTEFQASLLEQGLLVPYAASVLDMKDGSAIIRSGRGEDIENPLIISTPIDDDNQYILRLYVHTPYGKFVKNMWLLLLSSLVSIISLIITFVHLANTLSKQRALEQMRRDFTHNITHELKTPLSVAVAATDALQNFSADADIEKRGKYLEMINYQLSQLSAMVEQILEVSTEGKRMQLSISEFELKGLLGRIRQEVITTVKEIGLSIDCPEDLYIQADEFHLKNTLNTIIENSVKYAVQRPEVEIFVNLKHGFVVIEIADNGPGISKENIRHIFEKYYRVPTGDIQSVRGYGLGLYYAQKVIFLHGGEIEAKSKISEGTTIIIKLPHNG